MCRFNLYACVLFYFCNFFLLEGQSVVKYDSLFGYQLSVDGEDYVVKGVAGEKNLEILKDFGVTISKNPSVLGETVKSVLSKK